MTKPEIVAHGGDTTYPEPAPLPAQSDQGAPLGLFGTSNPAEVIEQAEATAEALTGVLEKRKLYSDISGKRHVRVEGWTLLGSMVGVFPVVEWTRKVTEGKGGWEARVEARTRSGELVGSAEAECLRSETRWEKADDYAIRSMAQTRATAKALRLPLGFIVQLAGFEATPAEEVPDGGYSGGGSSRPPSVGECPACGNEVWDNRPKRETGWNGPAFRCKNRDCDGFDGDQMFVSEGREGEPWVTWHEGYFDEPVEVGSLGELSFDEAMAGFTGDEQPGTQRWDDLQRQARGWLIERCRAAGVDAKEIWADAIASADLPTDAETSPPPELFLELVRHAGEDLLAPFMVAAEARAELGHANTPEDLEAPFA